MLPSIKKRLIRRAKLDRKSVSTSRIAVHLTLRQYCPASICFGGKQMTENPNLARLKAAYQAWNDRKGDSLKEWADLMDDQCRIASIHEDAPGLSFAADRNSKQECLDYLSAILKEWTMVHFTPEIYVCEGDNIAMFGRCQYTNIATGRDVECQLANLWRFNSAGKALKTTEVFDTAAAAAVAIPLPAKKQEQPS
ncbi:nuclear transport factor 2 family protein [Mesorhizobium sp. LHD-90]|uniref:nuclear transport factor 2 family protein n=1 Tax=Mesorhizobium sp. LHD-90 TaxID=3071414 RepID=UPI0027E1E221|nr:nuclear transport factor 2 family protein [Mesorhizobium sp. LHD-90]MDQ6434616.1 nuclear transport factor 2 family protein [Mesorhizobium sp. LHD-90]